MNRNTKMLLAATLISGLATGTAAFAKGADAAKKPGAEKSSCGGKDGCKGKNCKDKDAKGCHAKDKNECKGKNDCKGKDHKEEAPAAEGTAE
jgi:hypothetical protein